MSKESPSHFIKDFSKQEFQPERDELARHVKEVRAEQRDRREEERHNREALDLLDKQIEDLSHNGVSRVLNYFRLHALSQDREHQQIALEELQSQADTSPRELIDNFYRHIEDEWRKAPYDHETIADYFQEDYLAQLSLEDYGLLLSRFHREIATHATRQGVRDHADGGHISGMGEFHNGMKDILEHDRILSPLAEQINRFGLEQAIYNSLSGIIEEDGDYDAHGRSKREQLLAFWEHISHPSAGWAAYGDKSAVHFGYNDVLDSLYGGERGNEAFLVYPMQLIANEYFYKPSDKGNDRFHNDVWVWTKENQGMDLDASVVFLPEKTPVDPETGSCYLLDENLSPIIDTETLNHLEQFFDSPNFQAIESHVPLQGDSRQELHRILSTTELSPLEKAAMEQCFHNVRQFRQDEEMWQQEKWPGYENREPWQTQAAQYVAQELQLYYKHAEQTVPARDYWENYFTQHPDLRPSKLVYYRDTPNDALRRWLDSNNVSHEYDTDKPLVRDIMDKQDIDSEEAKRDMLHGHKEFYELGLAIIDRFAPEKA